MNALARRAAAILWKDVLAEMRTRQSITAMLSFAALVLFMFSFAIGPNRTLLGSLASGLIWVAIVFTGTLSLGRTFQSEEVAGGTRLLRLYPGDSRAIYLGKLVGNLLVLAALELLLFPAAAILYEVNFVPHLPSVLLVALLGSLGFSIIGTFFSALTVHLRARELLLPLLLFPALVPVVLGSVGAMEAALGGDPMGRAPGWLRLLASYDAILFVICLWVFPVILEE